MYNESDFRPSCGTFQTDTYKLAFQLTNVINLPLSSLAVYLIIVKSSRAMKTYKWFLLGHIIGLCFLNLIVTLGIIPYIIFPIWGGMSLGLFHELDLDEKIQFFIFMTAIATGSTSTVWLFYYRAQAVLPEGHRLKHTKQGRKAFMTLLLVVEIVAANHIGFLFVDGKSVEVMKKEFDEMLPCRNDILFDPRIHVLDPRAAKYLLTFFGLFSISNTLLVLIFSITLGKYLVSHKSFLSNTTRRLQMTFLKALSVQVTVSFAFIVIPSTVLISLRGVAVDRRKENSNSDNLQIPEYANDLGLIIQSFNLAGDVVALLLLNTPYRNALFCRKKKLREISSKVLDTRISIL